MENYVIDLKDCNFDHLQIFMNAAHEALKQEADNLSQELGVTSSCALDILYLRNRSRWTQQLEDKLIQLHKEGNPPNICEFE